MAIHKVLVVDDSKTELVFLTDLLQKNGFSVRTAENAETEWGPFLPSSPRRAAKRAARKHKREPPTVPLRARVGGGALPVLFDQTVTERKKQTMKQTEPQL